MLPYFVMDLNLLEYWDSDEMELRIPYKLFYKANTNKMLRVGSISDGQGSSAYVIYDSSRPGAEQTSGAVQNQDLLMTLLRVMEGWTRLTMSHATYERHVGVLYNFHLLVYLCKVFNLKLKNPNTTMLCNYSVSKTSEKVLQLCQGFTRIS